MPTFAIARDFRRFQVLMKKARRRIYRRIPQWIKDHDFEVFVGTLCLITGVPLLITQEVSSDALQALLPGYIVVAWAGTLTFGSASVLLGLWRASKKPIAYSVFWFRLEAWGLRALAYMGYVYTIAIASATLSPAVAIILAFALTCHTRSATVTIIVEDFLEGVGIHASGK